MPALLSAETALPDVPVIDEIPADPEPVPSVPEPVHTEPTLTAQDGGVVVSDIDVVVSPALAALQPPPTFEDVPLVFAAQTSRPATFVPTDLAAAGATFQAFLLNEGLAAFCHWRSLAQARSPAEAIRLQVDEIQRAADASLTCMGRMAGHLERIGAANAA